VPNSPEVAAVTEAVMTLRVARSAVIAPELARREVVGDVRFPLKEQGKVIGFRRITGSTT
jgi:hypothetical protein